MKIKCRICLNENNNKFTNIQETMYGTGIYYKYLICSKCNTMQLCDQIKDNIVLYPDDYYSFSNELGFIEKKLIFFRDRYIVERKNLLGYILSIFAKGPDMVALASVLKSKDYKVLDVGAGSGNFVKRLRCLGISRADGVDPYIKKTIKYLNQDLVKKAHINEITERYDVITFNHSFEHMSDFKEVLLHTKKILEDNGICIIRIPVFPSYAWDTYGENWVQIDAPRHFNIFSIQGIAELCGQCGFLIKSVYDDSNYFQFVGSERNMAKVSKKIHGGIFNRLINPFIYLIKNIKAGQLNRVGQGDQKTFILYKTNEKI
jgi:hypothetical protein